MLVLLAVVIGLGLIAELHAYLDALKHIRFSFRPMAETAEQGQVVEVCAQMANSGRLPISYAKATMLFPVSAILPQEVDAGQEQFAKTVDSVFRLWGRQTVRKTMRVRFEKRGVHFFKGATVCRGDYFGLFQSQERYEDQYALLVFPKALEEDTLRCAMGALCGDMIAQRHLLRDPILTMGVREYTGAEPMKTISWSQTARRAQLMVREFDYTRDMSCMVLFCTDGLQPTQEQPLDICCSIARTVFEELTSRNITVQLRTNGALYGKDRGNSAIAKSVATSGNLSDVLTTLALMYPAPARRPGLEMAVGALRSAGSGTAFVIIAPQASDQTEQMVRILREGSGMDVPVLLASDYSDAERR